MGFKYASKNFSKKGRVYVSQNNSIFQRKPTLYSNDLNFMKQEPRRYDILSNLASCFPHGNLRDNIEIYVSCATGLYNVCDEAKWKRICEIGDSLYHQLLQQKYREDCLAKLGVGKDVCDIPSWVQQFVMNAIRPKTTNVKVQAAPDMLDSGVQARPVQTAEMTVQATVDMLDSGIQARPVQTAEMTVQATVDMQDSGVQARPVKTAEMNVQVSENMLIFGAKAGPTKTTNTETQTASGTSQEPVSAKNVILQVNLTRDGKVNNIKTGGLELELDDDDAKIILEVMKRNMAKKNRKSVAAALGATAPTSRTRPPGFGLNPDCQKEMTAIVTRYHPKLPTATYISHLDSNFSPFRRYGYVAPPDMPLTMVDVKIPIVPNNDVVLKKQGNSTQYHFLGNGSFGFVYMAEYLKNTLASICVKDFDPDNSSTFDIYRETQTLLYLQSTHFVPKCYGLMDSPFTKISGAFAIVQECFGGGFTLKKLIDSPPANFGKWNWICIAYQLFHGLDIIHNKHVLFNDIKTDNVLVDVHANKLSNIRYIDFGLSSFRCGHRFTGNPEYMAQFTHLAPEVRQGFASTPASDVYSVGVIVNQICSTFKITQLETVVHMSMEKNPVTRAKCKDILQKLDRLLFL